MSPLSAARHNPSEGLDGAATGAGAGTGWLTAGVGTGWVTTGVGAGWVTAGGGGAAEATLVPVGGTEVLDAAGAE